MYVGISLGLTKINRDERRKGIKEKSIKMKKIGIVLASMLFSIGVSGQELSLPAANQYLADSEFLVAPTFAGIGNHVRVRASGVTQWLGIKDAPDYQSLSGDMRLGDRSGLGLVLYNDKNGFTKQMGGKFTFSHHLTLDVYDSHFLSFGISYMVNSFRIDIDKFDMPRRSTDVGVTDNRSTVNHNFEVGVLYRYKGLFGNLTASNILNKDTEAFGLKEPMKLRHYNLYLGYRYKRDQHSHLEIEPSLFTQYYEGDGRYTSDLNLKFRWFEFEDYYWAGLTGRFVNDQVFQPLSVGAMVGLKRNIFYFAYGYTFPLNQLNSYTMGSHMLTIGIDMFQGIGGCNCTER